MSILYYSNEQERQTAIQQQEMNFRYAQIPIISTKHYSQLVQQNAQNAQQAMYALMNHPGSSCLSQPQTSKDIGNEALKSFYDTTNKKPKENKMLGLYGTLKQYIQKHGDIIFTVILVMLADKYLFNGAFKGALKGMFDKLVTKANKDISALSDVK